MSQTHKITAVSPTTKDWSSEWGDMVTYYIKLDGEDDPIQLNKKKDSPAPKLGDELFGEVQSTEYGDKFKSAKKPFNGSKGGFSQKDQLAIRAQWAIGQAVSFHMSSGSMKEIEDTAKTFYQMVDRVKEDK